MRRLFGTTCLVVLCALATPAFADGDGDAQRVKAAADEFDAGRRAFKAKDFAVAAEHFENANRDAPAPEALRGAIRARKEAKQDARAATLAALAQARYPDDKATSALAKQVLAPVDKSLHQLTVHCDSPCTLLVDRKLSPWGESKDAVLWLDPGPHNVVASWGEGRDQKSDVTATAGSKSEISLVAPPATKPVGPIASPTDTPATSSSATSPPAEPASSGLPRGYFYGAVGLTAVLAGVSIWSEIAMTKSPGKDKVRADCVNQGESCPTFQDGVSAEHRTTALFVVTGVVAAGTAVLGAVFTDWKGAPKSGDSAPAAARVVPVVEVGRGFTLGASGSF